ncbi:hypothetical protein LSH36_509g01058 [Paralvinella palmiformis]|uniref:Receptor ligand binding region domain-containing protein n=1 Tax=Paralvinella palmiformis TaxID=53620 RepID=A0AAD9MWE4_9ANNE|nr:hypothetical protein LSH36_509g01058 [Paralvinella palmiformis]
MSTLRTWPAFGQWIFWILLFIGITRAAARQPQSITIGGIFEDIHEGSKLAFKQAVEKINSRRDLLTGIKLSYNISRCPPQDSFTADRQDVDVYDAYLQSRFSKWDKNEITLNNFFYSLYYEICVDRSPEIGSGLRASTNPEQTGVAGRSAGLHHSSPGFLRLNPRSGQHPVVVCRQIKDGVAAVFGPMSYLSAAHVQSICDAMEIPHVEARWDYNDNKEFFSINLFPDYMKLSQAFIDFISYSLAKLQEVLKAPEGHPFKITVRKLDTSIDGPMDYRPLLKEIRNKGGSRIILDCDYTKVNNILHQDADLIDLEDFKYNGVNITSFRIIDPTRPEVVEIIRDWQFQKRRLGYSPLETDRGPGFRTEAALMYDAVHLFAKALDELSGATEIRTASLSCNKGKPWAEGSSLINYMKMVSDRI